MAFSQGAVLLYFYIPFLLINIVVFSVYIYKMYILNNAKTRQKLSSLQILSHNICFIAIILTSIFDMLHGYGSMISNTGLMGKISTPFVADMEISADTFYYLSSLLLYIILISRLFSTFSNTSYAISKYFRYCITFQIALQSIFMSLFVPF